MEEASGMEEMPLTQASRLHPCYDPSIGSSLLCNKPCHILVPENDSSSRFAHGLQFGLGGTSPSRSRVASAGVIQLGVEGFPFKMAHPYGRRDLRASVPSPVDPPWAAWASSQKGAHVPGVSTSKHPSRSARPPYDLILAVTQCHV